MKGRNEITHIISVINKPAQLAPQLTVAVTPQTPLRLTRITPSPCVTNV
jgi:hypothetical protein